MVKKKKFWGKAKERTGQAFSILVLILVLLGSVVIVPVGYLSVVVVMLAENALAWLQGLSDKISYAWQVRK